MSLTSNLADPRSPVRQYLDLYAASVADAKRGTPWGAELQRLLGIDRLPKSEPVIPSTAEPRLRGSVGCAFDYRLRLFFPEPGSFLVAFMGSRSIAARSTGIAPAKRFDWLMENLTELRSSPGVPKDEEDERLLCRYCAVLAEFEAVYRSGMYMPMIPSSRRKTKSRVQDDPLLGMARPEVVEDLMALSRSVPETFGPLIDSVKQGVPFISNPTFAGSTDVGGADADFIISDALFEVKASSELKPMQVRNALMQMVGYVLLDYEDQYKIRTLGVYFARHKWVAAWPLWRMVFPLADIVRFGNDTEPSEDALLERLAVGREQLHIAATEGVLPNL